MRLPQMRYADGLRKSKQMVFRGLNHTLGAEDGELYEMQNMTSDHYPVLAVRSPRKKMRSLAFGGGIYSWEKLCWVDGTSFYYDAVVKGRVSAGRKQFASMGPYIIILPDKCCYNIETDSFRSMEAKWKGENVRFSDGSLYEEPAEGNCIYCQGTDWSAWFSAGDAVQISGCTVHPANNTSIIIRQIDGDKLYFYEHSFQLGDGTGYTEPGEIKIERTVPELLYICENENRLWACTRDTIYASKPGDPFNWNVYDGLDSDAWAVTPGSQGVFTGCVSYQGYPIFFKESIIYKIYGSLPSDFSPRGGASLGLAEGSTGSLAIAGETLFYLSGNGVMAYTGGIPQPVGEAFGLQSFRNAVAGSDGLKYYISMQDGQGAWGLYVYDTQKGLWHQEDDLQVSHFTRFAGNLYMLDTQGNIWVGGSSRNVENAAQVEEDIPWMVEFADFTEKDPNKKGVGKLQLRLELEAGAQLQVLLMFDSDGIWQTVAQVEPEAQKHSVSLPIVPRRADHYRLKLTGTGGCRIYSIAREYYIGSEMKSR